MGAYGAPTCPVIGGDPGIVGGEFGGGGGGGAVVTVIVNAGNEAVAVPSLTLIATFANVPAAVGVPCNWPVVLLKLAHAGRLAIENVSESLFASLAVGVNEYIVPTCPVVGGEPEIVGGVFAGGAAVTVSVNGGKLEDAVPSPTLIVMLAIVPAVVGVPASPPVVMLKVAQAGRF